MLSWFENVEIIFNLSLTKLFYLLYFNNSVHAVLTKDIRKHVHCVSSYYSLSNVDRKILREQNKRRAMTNSIHLMKD